jgi:hypothetical protein
VTTKLIVSIIYKEWKTPDLLEDFIGIYQKTEEEHGKTNSEYKYNENTQQ